MAEAGAERVRDNFLADGMLPWRCTDQSHAILDRYRDIGYDFVTITVALDESTEQALLTIAELNALIARAPDRFRLVRSARDIAQARSAGQMAISYNFQGTLPFQRSLDLVPVFADLGVGQVLLSYNQTNLVACGCAEKHDGGLSRFGRSLVKALASARIILDGSHVSERATFETMELTDCPFIFSHSNAMAVYPHYRNITDDQIKACAETGGYVGINGLNLFLGDELAESETMFRHIDHVVQLVGPQHAAVGLDYVQFEDPIDAYYETHEDAWPTNWHNGRPMRGIRSAQPEVVIELLKNMRNAGYGDDALKLILGGNILRVAEQIWG
jgi:membrane dipeptidase